MPLWPVAESTSESPRRIIVIIYLTETYSRGTLARVTIVWIVRGAAVSLKDKPCESAMIHYLKMKQFITNALVIASLVLVIYMLSGSGASWP